MFEGSIYFRRSYRKYTGRGRSTFLLTFCNMNRIIQVTERIDFRYRVGYKLSKADQLFS